MNTANKLLIVGPSLLGVIAIATLDYTINKITFLSKDKNEIVASDSNGFYQPKPNLKTTSAYGSLTNKDRSRVSRDLIRCWTSPLELLGRPSLCR
jgi:hypothetical protein